MITSPTPATKNYFVNLPPSRLHVMEAGAGEPLIIVPATISELNEWRSLVQFMAQWFRVYFFELPGHGESSAFKGGFSSHKVAELVSQLADELGFERFNLMGFSFGGLLAMRTYKHLSHRIDRLILIAPCLDHRALPLSNRRRALVYKLNQLLGHPPVQKKFLALVHNPGTISMIVSLLRKIGRLENTLPLREKLSHVKAGTVAVLNSQLKEILTTEFETETEKHNTPCYFAMSIHDPLIRFDPTVDILHRHFSNVNTVKLYYPYHQPPTPFTYEELNGDFHDTVDSFLRTAAREEIPQTPCASSPSMQLPQSPMTRRVPAIPLNGCAP
ncbi:MAG TPA: alpha/beta hydrolase [Anaerolineales bacterium]|nr:alpha/beta hydrolase [Anaerolineales bacterium]